MFLFCYVLVEYVSLVFSLGHLCSLQQECEPIITCIFVKIICNTLSNFYPHDTNALRLSLLFITDHCFVKLLQDQAAFLSQSLPLAYLTLCFKEIWLSSK